MDNLLTKQNRNCSIDILRFIFCFYIVNYHFYSHCLKYIDSLNFFCRGYMGDEFFFMVTGFYFAKAGLSAKESPIHWNFNQLIKRIKKIAIPYYSVWLVCFILTEFKVVLLNIEDRTSLNDLVNSVYELLFLDMAGFRKGLYVNDVAWFFSGTIISLFLLGPFIAKFKEKFLLYAAPVISIFSYGLLCINFDYLHSPHAFIPNSFIQKGLVRSVAAICAGCFLFELTNNEILKKSVSSFISKCKGVIRILDVYAWIVIFTYTTLPFESNIEELAVQYDYLIVILMFFAMIPVVFNVFEPASGNKAAVIADKAAKYSFYAYFGQAVFYVVDIFIYSLDISILAKALTINLSVPIITILLMCYTKLVNKIGLKTAVKRTD